MSRRCLARYLVCRSCAGVDQRGDGRVTAQLVQAAAAGRADAPGSDAQPGADLGVRLGRVGESMAISRWQQEGRCLSASRSAALRSAASSSCSAITARSSGMLLGVQHVPGCLRSARAQTPGAFSPGRGGEPAGKRSRIAECVKPFHQVQPHALADVVGVGVARRRLRQMAQISGAYRSTSASHACRSPFLARVTRSVTAGSSRLELACSAGFGFADIAFLPVVPGRLSCGPHR